MMPPGCPRVAVFGGSRCAPGEPDWEVALELGRGIAAAGWTLVTGGYGGIMEAASRGAREAGGPAVGVLCSVFRSGGNAYLTETMVTPDLFARVRTIVENGHAYVVLPGSTGTLVELAMVWEFLNKGILRERPLIVVGGFWHPVIELLGGESLADNRVQPPKWARRAADVVLHAATPGDALRLLAERLTRHTD
jgi:uncharacterized protein (TIGR00730 family)